MVTTMNYLPLSAYFLLILFQKGYPYAAAANWVLTDQGDAGACLAPTNDGHYYIAFLTTRSIWETTVRKLNGNNLGQMWNFAYACPSIGQNSETRTCVKDADGSFLVGVYRPINCNVGNGFATYVMKITAGGTLTWGHDFGQIYEPRGMMAYIGDGGSVIAGFTGAAYGVVIRLDLNGALLNQITWTEPTTEAWQPLYLPDGNFLQVGWITPAPNKCLLKKYSPTLTEMWGKVFEGAGKKICFAITATTTGYFVLGGESTVWNLGGNDAYAVKVDADGNIIWEKGYGGSGDEYIRGVHYLTDGTIALAGATTTGHPAGLALWVCNIDDATGDQYSSFTDGHHPSSSCGLSKTTYAADRFVALACNFDPGSGNWNDVFVLEMEPDCRRGYRRSDTLYGCTICPAGQYQDLLNQVTCKTCAVGTYQPAEGQASCITCESGKYCPTLTTSIACPAGYEQPATGKTLSTDCTHCASGAICIAGGCSTCTACTPGFYDDSNGLSACKACAEGTYQDQSSQTGCKICPADQYPSVNKDVCLIKGIFADTPTFTASPMSTTCYDYSNNIITPFPIACRTAYRALCCDGATRKTTVNCNFGLGSLSLSVSMHDNYCSACTFQDQTKCPVNGVCWDDTTWVNNAANPYPSDFTQQCYADIKDYCKLRLQTDTNDPECAPFTSKCGSMISANSYGTLWNKFRITFTKILPAVLPNCNAIFNTISAPNAKTGTIGCTRVSDTEMDVDVSKLAAGPISSYKLNANSFLDYCGFDLPSTTTHTITTPTVDPLNPFETFKISYTTNNDKCQNLTVTTSVQVFL